MVKCLPEFEYFTVFLKNRNFISKIRISKVTDYAALSHPYLDILGVRIEENESAMHRSKLGLESYLYV